MLRLEDLRVDGAVTFLDDPHETVIATVTRRGVEVEPEVEEEAVEGEEVEGEEAEGEEPSAEAAEALGRAQPTE